MNVVIVGSGRTGAFLAELLDHSGDNTVSIVDLDRSAFKRLPADFHGTPVLGDGTDMDILRQAGIERQARNRPGPDRQRASDTTSVNTAARGYRSRRISWSFSARNASTVPTPRYFPPMDRMRARMAIRASRDGSARARLLTGTNCATRTPRTVTVTVSPEPTRLRTSPVGS